MTRLRKIMLEELERPSDLFSYDFYKQIENQSAVFGGLCAFGSFTQSVRVRLAGPASGLPAVNLKLSSP